ncbi:MAG: DNA translocase FtsK 4TM domain-containing protein [Phascolarctobacterium sp.]|nr:DNA translocase FtsK 4TM domain-containing protein [Phascolarctobacterium sp.]
MTRGRVKKKQQLNNGSTTAVYVAGFFLLVSLVSGAALWLEGESGVMAFLGKFQHYLLGKGSFLLPLFSFVLAWKLYIDRKITVFQKETLAIFMVMLCLLGTAHHIFVPVSEELVPQLLPEGGGLIGGLIVLPLHKYLGSIGTWIVLVLLWGACAALALPVRTIWSWLVGLIKDMTGESDDYAIAEAKSNQEQAQRKQAVAAANMKATRSSVRTFPPQQKGSKPTDKNAITQVYKSGEFGSFTEGLEHKPALNLKRILGGGTTYEKEPVKQQLEQDPIQVPEWQDARAEEQQTRSTPRLVDNYSERERTVVLRPVINYDGAGNASATAVNGSSAVGGAEDASQTTAAPQLQQAEEQNAGSIIHNEYRQKAQTDPAPAAAQPTHTGSVFSDIEVVEEEQEPAAQVFSDESMPASQGAQATDGSARQIAIYDSADKVQGAVQGETQPQPASEQAVIEQQDNVAVAIPAANEYLLPPLELLNTPRVSDPNSYQRDIMEQCAILEQTLADFRVRAKVIAVTRGPSVTRFELEPAPGVKVSSVVNLADDIALRLAAPGVRIEAPIPGKSAIGIEAPNTKNDTVCFREVVEDIGVRKAPSRLCIGLGKDISGDIISADLAKMPHLLVAGSTGSGKSVCINTIIAGILYKARPEEVKLILVDPKVVELSNYNGIPHLLTPVVTEPKKAASALHWAVAEMERRYKAFADNHVREINSYNAQAAEKMPFIVIIIDELSDLMMVAKVDVEEAILRLAQKARAAGIHLILATQRPSVDVITGIVKANIPSRIAFAVSSQTDSRTIIDMGGAEKLLGKGDMLFYPIGMNKPVRVQGAFVTDEELNKIVEFIVGQSIPVNYTEEVTEQELECDAKNKNSTSEEQSSDAPAEDELFADALSLVLDMGQASSSMLQRRFRIGYTRAARLVDTMEELGIVGQSVGSKPREVIISRQEAEERFLKRD